MTDRPHINLVLSKMDRITESLSVILVISVWIVSIFSYIKLPTIIPIHFDAAGKPNGYGNKLTLFVMPLLATVISLGLTKLNQYPQIFNYPIKITNENAKQQYSNATEMLRYLKLSILIIFNMIIVFSYCTSIGYMRDIGAWFLPLTLIITFSPVLILIARSLKQK